MHFNVWVDPRSTLQIDWSEIFLLCEHVHDGNYIQRFNPKNASLSIWSWPSQLRHLRPNILESTLLIVVKVGGSGVYHSRILLGPILYVDVGVNAAHAWDGFVKETPRLVVSESSLSLVGSKGSQRPSPVHRVGQSAWNWRSVYRWELSRYERILARRRRLQRTNLWWVRSGEVVVRDGT